MENRDVPGALPKPPRANAALQPSNRSQLTTTAPQKAPGTVPRGGSGSDSVKVVVRLRPQAAGSSACLRVKDKQVVVVPKASVGSGQETSLDLEEFRYDHVADGVASQESIFQVAGKPLVENFLAGYDGAILAYGQTGSGKTYTMTGNGGNEGLIQACFRQLFHSLSESAKKGRLGFTVNVSYVEIYRDAINDLLGAGEGLEIETDRSWGPRVRGVTEVEVDSADSVLRLLQRGAERRKQAATRMNERSSRSHAVLTCSLVAEASGAGGTRSRRFSQLHLVDLAGSEQQGQTQAEGKRLKEAKGINLSLTWLGECIRQTIKKQENGTGFVPVRNSKLTKLLQHALSGNAKLALIATVSPSTANLEMTRSTLRFANDIKQLRVKAVVNCEVSGNGAALALVVKQLKAELEQVKQEAAAKQQQEEELARLRGQLEEKEMALQREKSRRVELEQQLAGLQATAMAADSSNAQLAVDAVIKKEMASLREEVEFLQAQVDSLSADLAGARDAESEALLEKLDLQDQLCTWRKAAATSEAAAKDLEGQLLEAQQAHNSTADAFAAALVRSAELEGQLQAAQQAHSSAADALAAALARSQELEAQLGSLQRARGRELHQAQRRLDEECTGPAGGQAAVPGMPAEDAASYAMMEAGSPAENLLVEQRQAAAGAAAVEQGGRHKGEEEAGCGGTPEPGSLLQRFFQRAGLCSSGPLAGQPDLVSAASGSNPLTVAGLAEPQPAQQEQQAAGEQQQTSPFQGAQWQEAAEQLEGEGEEQGLQGGERPGMGTGPGGAAPEQQQQQMAGSQGVDSLLEQALASSGRPSPLLAGSPSGDDSPLQLEASPPVEQQDADIATATAAAVPTAAAAADPKPPQQQRQGTGGSKKGSKRAASGAKRETACDRASRKAAAVLAMSARSFKQRAAGLGTAAAAPLATGAAAAGSAVAPEAVDLTADSDNDSGTGGSRQQDGGAGAAAAATAVLDNRNPQVPAVSAEPAKRLRGGASAQQVAAVAEAAPPANEGRKRRKLLPVSSSRLTSKQ